MEIDHLLTTDSGSLVTYDDDEALAKANFWFDTPRGQYWGNSLWGNRLEQFRHEPVDEVTEVAMENSIVTDLPRDIPALTIFGIHVEIMSQDEININIQTNFGDIQTTF